MRRPSRPALFARRSAAALACAVALLAPVPFFPAHAVVGAAWTPAPVPAVAEGVLALEDVWAAGPDQVYAVGAVPSAGIGSFNRPSVSRWDGSAWHELPGLVTPGWSSVALHAVDGSSATDVWTVGTGTPFGTGPGSGPVLRWDGARWTSAPVPALPGAGRTSWSDVAVPRRGEVWLVGESQGVDGLDTVAAHRTAAGWTVERVPAPPVCTGLREAQLLSVAPTRTGVVAAGTCATRVGDGFGRRAFIMERSAGTWRPVLLRPDGDLIAEVTVTAAGEVWVAGTRPSSGGTEQAFVVVRRGTAWTELRRAGLPAGVSENVRGVAAGPDGVTVVGSSRRAGVTRPLVLTRTASGWTRHEIVPSITGSASLEGVAWDGSRSWAVGSSIEPGPTYRAVVVRS